jgi:hypothetical protein
MQMFLEHDHNMFVDESQDDCLVNQSRCNNENDDNLNQLMFDRDDAKLMNLTRKISSHTMVSNRNRS